MNLYAEYIKERENLEIIKHEKGFLTYRVEDDHLFISDLYITPSARGTGVARELSDRAYEIAKKDKVLCAVCTDANGWKESFRFIQHMGYKPLQQVHNMIYLIKEL